MKIIFDFNHIAHVNFFKPAINLLKAEGHEVIISVLERGKLLTVVQKEFPDYKIYKAGSHQGGFFSIIMNANIRKIIRLINIVTREKVVLGVGISLPLAVAMTVLRKKVFQFNDDPERKLLISLQKKFSTLLTMPYLDLKEEPKIRVYQALKEWAYLSPRYFNPQPAVLAEYGLEAGKYIFVREVSTGSLNYQGQQANVIAQFADRFPKDYRVVLSLEDKKTIGQYPSDWILLKEPVSDIHSLIYYSRCLISSGDSMAREGAMLGVPSVYCGFREMKANRVMVDEGMLVCEQPEHCPALLEEIVSGSKPFEAQDAFRNRLLQQWEDVTLYIIQLIKKYK